MSANLISSEVRAGAASGAAANPAEIPFYMDRDGEQIYHVFHQVKPARAAALLMGPFPTERAYAYSPWVRWARYLSSRGISALRFDYRGAGESTGTFADVSLASWVEDARHSLAWLRAAEPGKPVLIHGLGFGALIAGALGADASEALLSWSPPESAEEAMKEILMRRIAADFKMADDGKRKTWDDYVRELEEGACVDVQGYLISGRIWSEARSFAAAAVQPPEGGRAVRSVKLNRRAAPLIAGIGQWRSMDPNLQTGRVPLEPDLTWLFEENVAWLEQALSLGKDTPP